MPILILRRLLILIPILIGISILSFVLVSLSPSDPAEVSIRVNAMVPTPELIALTRHELGLDQPFWQRYFQWCGAVLHGDFGQSYITGRPVAEEICEAFPPTLFLAVVTLGFILILSLPAGIICARWEGKTPDHWVRSFIFFTSAFPAFWAGNSTGSRRAACSVPPPSFCRQSRCRLPTSPLMSVCFDPK